MKRVAVGWIVAALAAVGFARFGLRRLRGREELGELTKDELYRRAQRADIAGRSEMTKDELVDALRGS